MKPCLHLELSAISIEAIYARIPNLHERIFTDMCLQIQTRCENGCVTERDFYFLEDLPETVEIFGYKPEVGVTIRSRFKKAVRKADWREQRMPQKYAFNPMVTELYSKGESIRQIAQKLGMSKANVERGLREYRAQSRQMVFPFYYDVAVVTPCSD